MIKEHSLKVQRSAHYYTLGQPGPHITKLWIVCHGYGQLGSSLLHKFEEFDDGQTLIIAPEGLSRFYWGGFSGPVVSSWMTSQNRLEEIDDYCNMLDQIYAHYVSQLASDVQINLLGFSQGCATQIRWILARKPHFHRLVLWAGTIPDDLDYRPQLDYLSSKDIYLLYGDEDPFLTPPRIKQLHELIEEKGMEVTAIPFKGKHEVVKAVLVKQFG